MPATIVSGTIATVENPTYFSSAVEHAFVFERENGDQVSFCVDHTKAFGPIPLTVIYRSEDPAVPDEHGVEYFGTPTHMIVYTY